MARLQRRPARIGDRIGVWMYRTLDGAGQRQQGQHRADAHDPRTPHWHTALDVRAVPREPGGPVVWGTGAGSPRPDCLQNLRHASTAAVQVRAPRFEARPRELLGDERDAMWRTTIVAQVPGVERYARKSGRTIPVAVLEPL